MFNFKKNIKLMTCGVEQEVVCIKTLHNNFEF